MPGKQAKILSDQQIQRLLTFASSTRYPSRDRLIVLLSAKAGLRAGEIAKLTWDMVLGPTGEIGTVNTTMAFIWRNILATMSRCLARSLKVEEI